MNERLNPFDASVETLLSTLEKLVRAAVREELGEQLLSVRSAAKLAGFSEHAVRKQIERGHLPATRIAGRIRIRRSDLLRANGPRR